MPIVRIDKKLVYFAHVPKCAGTSIERYLINRFGPLAFLDWKYDDQSPAQKWNVSSPQHIETDAFARLMPPSFIEASFATVRHPTHRLISVYRYQRDTEGEIPQGMGFGDWLRQIPGQGPRYLDNHARPMADLVPKGATIFMLEKGLAPLVDWLDALAGQDHGTHEIEVLNSYLQRLALKGKTPGNQIDVTDADHDWIAKHYAVDFERFGYVPSPDASLPQVKKKRPAPKKGKPLRILVFGETGQVATELRHQAPVGAALTVLSRSKADLSDPASCVAQIAGRDVDVVINAAAYTAVDKAEDEEALATAVNGAAPSAMACAAAKLDIPFIHISTDYVFDGSGTDPWPVDAPVGPLGAYGRSKLAGEEGVRAAGGPHVILRTSWVFSSHGNNFVKTMLRLGRERDTLRIVADQVGGPTAATDIAATCLSMAQILADRQGKSGTYHYSGAPDVSWADFAREIFAQSDLSVEVEDIATSDYPTPAARPANSRLDCSSLQTAFGIVRPDWRVSLAKVLSEILESTT